MPSICTQETDGQNCSSSPTTAHQITYCRRPYSCIEFLQGNRVDLTQNGTTPQETAPRSPISDLLVCLKAKQDWGKKDLHIQKRRICQERQKKDAEDVKLVMASSDPPQSARTHLSLCLSSSLPVGGQLGEERERFWEEKEGERGWCGDLVLRAGGNNKKSIVRISTPVENSCRMEWNGWGLRLRMVVV